MAHRPAQRVSDLIESTRGLEPKEKVQRLTEHAQALAAEQRLRVMESLNVTFGGGQATMDLVFDDPRYDSGDFPWDEVSFAGGFRPGGSFGLPLLRGQLSLTRARNIGRALWAENEFAIGAHRLRQSYVVGCGVVWRFVPRDLETEDEGLTRAISDALLEFSEENRLAMVEREIVLRRDRDGEALIRMFANAAGPLAIRFAEPEILKDPVDAHRPELAPILQFGVETVPGDPSTRAAYWLAESEEGEPTRVEAVSPLTGLQHIVHFRGQTDMNARRGWPLMWPARRNLVRAEKLLRNMSVVAGLQAAIALIRKHEAATKTEVEAFLDTNRDLLLSNTATGRDTRYQAIEGGLVIDSGQGISYEAPVSSVNASNNVEVLRAELRSVAAMLNMPESMFTSQIDGSFAGSLVSEAPFTKYMEAVQSEFAWDMRTIVRTAIEHEVFWNRLPERALTDYRLTGEFTSLEVRDFLREAQKRQIEHTAGVLSTKTWRQKAGYDDEIERRNMEAEPSKQAEPTDKPALGSTDGGPGGQDQAGNEDDPGSAADSNFAQADAQGLTD